MNGCETLWPAAEADRARAELDSERATLVEETGSDAGDVIRAAVPIRSSDTPDEIVGVVVVNHLVPHALAREGIEAVEVAVKSRASICGSLRSNEGA